MKKLTLQDYSSLLQLFEECLLLCLPDGSSSLDPVQLLIYKPGESSGEQTPYLSTPHGSSLVQSCLPLFQNFVLFEAAHGDVDKAMALLDRYVSACPKLTQLWTLYARLVFKCSLAPPPAAGCFCIACVAFHLEGGAGIFQFQAQLSPSTLGDVLRVLSHPNGIRGPLSSYLKT